DIVPFDHDLFGASLVSLSHEGHFGWRACLEFDGRRLEAFAIDLDGRCLHAVLQRRLSGRSQLSRRHAAILWRIATILRGLAAFLRTLAAFLRRLTAFPRGLAAILRALATILRGAERQRRQSDGHDEQRDSCDNRFSVQSASPNWFRIHD